MVLLKLHTTSMAHVESVRKDACICSFNHDNIYVVVIFICHTGQSNSWKLNSVCDFLKLFLRLKDKKITVPSSYNTNNRNIFIAELNTYMHVIPPTLRDLLEPEILQELVHFHRTNKKRKKFPTFQRDLKGSAAQYSSTVTMSFPSPFCSHVLPSCRQ